MCGGWGAPNLQVCVHSDEEEIEKLWPDRIVGETAPDPEGSEDGHTTEIGASQLIPLTFQLKPRAPQP